MTPTSWPVGCCMALLAAGCWPAGSAALAADLAVTAGTTGIIVAAGDTGSFPLSGPFLIYKKDGDKGGELKCKPVFAPGADAASGTISYPDSPGKATLSYRIAGPEQRVEFTGEGFAPSPVSVSFELEFLVGQFIGGAYAVGDKPAVRLPIEQFKGETFRDGKFSITGRDGQGLSVRTAGGFTAFSDTRKYNGDKYRWSCILPLKSGDRNFAITFAGVASAPPALDLKPPGPPASGTWEPLPELSDDFDGTTLDATKWNDHDPSWEGRVPSWFNPKNVVVQDGRLQLVAKLEDPPPQIKAKGSFHTWTVGCVTSKKRVLYGYFEAKAKVLDVRICNAFWFYYNHPVEHWQSEIDVFEICGGRNAFDRTLFNTVQVFEGAKKGNKHWAKTVHLRTAERPADGFHLYGMDWGKDEISFYYDGFLFARYPNTDWHIPLNLDFDNEVNTPWFGPTEKTGFPTSFDIEYIHAWRRTDGASPSELLDSGKR